MRSYPGCLAPFYAQAEMSNGQSMRVCSIAAMS